MRYIFRQRHSMQVSALRINRPFVSKNAVLDLSGGAGTAKLLVLLWW